MRSLTFTLCCFLCIGAFGLANAVNINETQQSSYIDTRIWIIKSQTDADEHKYVIDLQKGTLASSNLRHIHNRREAEFEAHLANKEKLSSDTYLRLQQRVKAWKGKSLPDENLLKALQVPDFIRWVSPSPNGLYAIIIADDIPILLVEIDTLRTFLIGKGRKEHSYLKTPVAWSHDSRLVVFSPHDSDSLYFYDINKKAIVLTKSGVGRWIQELSWSPDKKQVAAFTYQNRRLSKTPFGLLGSMLGHPDYRNDGVISVYRVEKEQNFSIVLKRGMSEMDSSEIEFEWK